MLGDPLELSSVPRRAVNDVTQKRHDFKVGTRDAVQRTFNQLKLKNPIEQATRLPCDLYSERALIEREDGGEARRKKRIDPPADCLQNDFDGLIPNWQ
jgi:hypothetical protein